MGCQEICHSRERFKMRAHQLYKSKGYNEYLAIRWSILFWFRNARIFGGNLNYNEAMASRLSREPQRYGSSSISYHGHDFRIK